MGADNEYRIRNGQLVATAAIEWGGNTVLAGAVIDTGAQKTAVVGRVLDRLGAPKVEENIVSTVHGQKVASIHRVQVGLPQTREVRNAEVVRVPRIRPGIDVLLGVDVLRSVHLIVDAGEGMFRIEPARNSRAERNQLRRVNRRLSKKGTRIRKTCIRERGHFRDDPDLGRFYFEQVDTGEVLSKHVNLDFVERLERSVAEAAAKR